MIPQGFIELETGIYRCFKSNWQLLICTGVRREGFDNSHDTAPTPRVPTWIESTLTSGASLTSAVFPCTFVLSRTFCFRVVESMAVATLSLFTSFFSFMREGYANKSGGAEQITEKHLGISKSEFRPTSIVGASAKEKK